VTKLVHFATSRTARGWKCRGFLQNEVVSFVHFVTFGSAFVRGAS
jgi:hypothetical protein